MTTTSAVVDWLLHGRVEDARCSCSGQCGRHQSRRVCGVDHPDRLRLAPVDLSVPIDRAAGLAPSELMFWCHSCRDSAEAVERRRRREQAAELEAAQPGLWSAA